MSKKRTQQITIAFTERELHRIRATAEDYGETVNQFFRNIALDWARTYEGCKRCEEEEEAKQRAILAKKLIVPTSSAKACLNTDKTTTATRDEWPFCFGTISR